ncbi:sporulation integral membrane protein YlbJ [Halalkalibacter hemicellulosilyticus]|uniref:sporulation integral membrane protein YlbJ n=1 Tax=Halalkalibacter hemicellulosilyticus TaxID=127886 RepID=UPI0009DFFA03
MVECRLPILVTFFYCVRAINWIWRRNVYWCITRALMRPLFRVPGVGGFVWAMGLASGYPAGAKLTARLRQEQKLTRIEAERLVSFTNSSNPLFIFGAIAVGFFHDATLGLLLALSHYLGNIIVGLCMRFHGVNDEERQSLDSSTRSWKSALTLLHEERLRDGRPIGKLLGDAVQSSIRTLLMIGGFIILFSVLNSILSLIGITAMIAAIFSIILSIFQIPNTLSYPLISGLFEITLGAKLASETDATLFQQVIVTSFFLAFSGFSVQAQVASILAETDIRFKPFFIARFFHGVFAALFACLLWTPIYRNQTSSNEQSSVLAVFMSEHSAPWFSIMWNWLVQYGFIMTFFMLVLYLILLLKRVDQHI